jgi:hypothetical protein
VVVEEEWVVGEAKAAASAECLYRWFATNGPVTAAIAAMLKVTLYTFHSRDVIH